MKGYILVHTEAYQAGEVGRRIAGLDGVLVAETVTGPYDVIVLVQADSPSDMLTGVTAAVQAVPGVVRTVTCVEASNQPLWEERATVAALARA